MTTRLLCVVLATLSLFFLGCGDSSGGTTAVEGKVSIDGSPLQKGLISFTPLEPGSSAVTAEIRDGSYHATDVPIGRTLVQFHAPKETGRTIFDEATWVSPSQLP